MQSGGAIAGISTRCPTCGQRVSRGGLPRFDLNSNTVSRSGLIVPSEPKIIEFGHILREAWPRAVKVERIIPRLWGSSLPNDPAGCLRTYAYRLRRILEPMGHTIERIQGVRDITLGGYRLVKHAHTHTARAPADRRTA